MKVIQHKKKSVAFRHRIDTMYFFIMLVANPCFARNVWGHRDLMVMLVVDPGGISMDPL